MSLRRLPRRIFILAGIVPLVLALWGPAGARAAGGAVADSSCTGRPQNVGPQIGCGGPATSLIFSTEPGGAEVNDPLNPQPVVEAVDDGNNIDPTYDLLVTISIDTNPGGGTLHGTTTVQAVDGVATFTDLSIDQPGVGYTLEATGPEPARAGAVQPADLAPAVSDPFDITAPTGPTPADCSSIYGVSDTHNNSSFFKVGTVPPTLLKHLGGVNAGYNFEGIEIDPLDGSIYAATAAGNKHGQKGTIFQVDGLTGALTLDFSTGYQDVEGLAFRSDGALWAWVDGKGLIIMDPVLKLTGVAVLSKRHFEALAWNNAGDKLYLAKANKLWTWDPSTLAFKLVASNLPSPVLGMDVRPDGDLLLGVGTQQKILIWNPITKSTVGSIATPGFGSIQSLARAEPCNAIG